MAREEFIKGLDKKGYSYEIEGNKIVVTIERSVWLESLTSLPLDVKFENGGRVYLDSLTSLPPGVEFKNRGGVYLNALLGGYFNEWNGNIEGIDSKRLLNLMISKGIFER